ncbi:cation-translocating P-type ATPase [Derxia gummosa]|uniref:Cation-translocating P-type ATPase n=1 Tax=Derxia gummosa DSM 723 TaxID=1121388 RepID=A0A8B6X9V8_9BURK|nr:HAD-IC family P-type ATPase [Derxia gummosa]
MKPSIFFVPRCDWHAVAGTDASARLGVDPATGLASDEAASRLASHGPNVPTGRPGRPLWRRVLDQLVAPLVAVLIAAGVVTAALGEWVDAGVILGVVAINALVGLLQEGKAEAALAALARAMQAEATVLRDGARRRLDSAALVPGDIVLLAAGDKVPADLRLLHGKALRSAEAALTGESAPVGKHCDALAADTALADRRNMAYAGCLVVAGQGSGVVVATGDATEAGRLSRLMAEAPDLATPLTRQIAAFTRRLLVVIGLLTVLTFGIGVWRGEPPVEMFVAAVALAVGAIPEGLPAAVTVTLAIGVARMARRRAVIRRLPAVETLGSTTVICTDKTGTLTENEMTVRRLHAGGMTVAVTGQGYAPEGRLTLLADMDGTPIGAACPGPAADAEGDAASDARSGAAPHSPALRELLLAGVLCNDARLRRDDSGRWSVVGDPTEAALIVAARKAGLDDATLLAVFPRRDEQPFDSARQTMATLHEIEGRPVVCAKGALERLLPACARVLDADGQPRPLDDAARDAIVRSAAAMTADGLRVLAFARRELPAAAASPGADPGADPGAGPGAGPGCSTDAARARLPDDALAGDLVFLGFAGMIDPPRATARAAVAACHAAGIDVKMITGDHPGTALAIARQLGIVDDADAAVLTGRDLARLDRLALGDAAAHTHVFARVEPEQKLRLVEVLQLRGEVVAMTGDGVNDAPALRQADIGIAMGQGGTDVAKEAAAMVLTDDNFATIEAAVEEGRAVYDNLVRFILWTLPTNLGEGLVILAAIVAGSQLPITPLQVLWINMTTAVLLGMTLAFDPAAPGLMTRPPREPGAGLLDARLLRRTGLVSALLLAGAFGGFELALRHGLGLAEARTVAMNLFVLVETVYLFNCRAGGPNPWLWRGTLAMLALQAAMTWLPWFNAVFGSAPIGAAEWGLMAAYALGCGLVIRRF